jgi:hypothetical protein
VVKAVLLQKVLLLRKALLRPVKRQVARQAVLQAVLQVAHLAVLRAVRLAKFPMLLLQ